MADWKNETSAKSKAIYACVEDNIYREYRSKGSVRFKVQVFPLAARTRTLDRSAEVEGLHWARVQRTELQGLKLGLRCDAMARPAPSTRESHESATSPAPTDTEKLFGQFGVAEILGDYEKNHVSKLSKGNGSAAKSRLKTLIASFGTLTLAQVTRSKLETWREARLSGELGSGRGDWREQAGGEPIPTKDQRRRLRAKQETARQETRASEPAPLELRPVSTQTARHELRLLRTACNKFFDAEVRERCRPWLSVHPLMTISLPAACEPRERRLSEEEQRNILARCHSAVARQAMMFAVASSIRRGETVSVRWEDVDFRHSVVKLRKQGRGRSKTRTRDVPLTPDAIKVLRSIGPKERGLIFEIKANSLTQAWRRAADRAGYPDARLHDLRREAISSLVDNGLSLEYVMVFSGHARLDVLQKFYLKPNARVVAKRAAMVFSQMTNTPTVG